MPLPLGGHGSWLRGCGQGESIWRMPLSGAVSGGSSCSRCGSPRKVSAPVNAASLSFDLSRCVRSRLGHRAPAAGKVALRVVGSGAPPGGETLQSLVGQLVTKTYSQVSGLMVKKELPRVYSEPHWVLLLNVAIIFLLRAGLARSAQRVLKYQLRNRKAVPASGRVAAEVEGTDDAEALETGEEKDSSSAEGPAPNTVSVRGDGDQKVEDRDRRREFSRSVLAMVIQLLEAGEAPVIVCCLLSIVCHLSIIVLKLTSGPAAEMAKNTMWRVWVGQELNYTLCGSWLILRFLNVRLQLSRSRPSLSGDLTYLIDTAGITSRRFAHESAVAHIFKTFVFVVAGLLVLRHLGVNVQRVLALTGLSGVAFSFLLGDILNNLFGGFVLYVTQPFAQGDWVQSPDGKVDGWIQNVGWYYTALVQWDKRPHYIPNSTFGFMPIVNCSRMTHRRILIEGPLRIRDLDKVEEIMKDVQSLIDNHTEVDKNMHRLCRLKKVDDYSVTLWVSCYIRTITLAKFLAVQESVLMGICGILAKYKTNWASNTERFRSYGGDLELTAESKRILNARSALLRHEKDLEARQHELDEQSEKVSGLRAGITGKRKKLEPVMGRARLRKDLLGMRRKSLVKLRAATKARREALFLRSEALKKLASSIEILQLGDRDEAAAQSRTSLQMREASVQKTWSAVVIERGAIESEKDAIEQERELLAQETTVDTEAQRTNESLDISTEESSVEAASAEAADDHGSDETNEISNDTAKAGQHSNKTNSNEDPVALETQEQAALEPLVQSMESHEMQVPEEDEDGDEDGEDGDKIHQQGTLEHARQVDSDGSDSEQDQMKTNAEIAAEQWEKNATNMGGE